MSTLVNRAIELIGPLFPADARIRQEKYLEHVDICIDWKLGTDRTRRSKRSKLLRLRVQSDDIDDYADGDGAVRVHIERRLLAFARERRGAFCATHTAGIMAPPPEEVWQFSVATK